MLRAAAVISRGDVHLRVLSTTRCGDRCGGSSFARPSVHGLADAVLAPCSSALRIPIQLTPASGPLAKVTPTAAAVRPIALAVLALGASRGARAVVLLSTAVQWLLALRALQLMRHRTAITGLQRRIRANSATTRQVGGDYPLGTTCRSCSGSATRSRRRGTRLPGLLVKDPSGRSSRTNRLRPIPTPAALCSTGPSGC